MTGRVVIVTGASSGLGFEVAKRLCEAGDDVVLACQDEDETKVAIDKIKQQTPSAVAAFMQLDLTSTESVCKFVDEFHATGKKLSVLINCAGIKSNSSPRTRQYSADNFDLTMSANHLGHFLLTNLLLADLKNTSADGGDARIVVVTSSLHDTKANKQCRNLQPLDVDNLFLFTEKTYSALQAYKNSRAANLLFTYELARRVQDSGIKVNAVCPGVDPVSDTTANGSGLHKLFSCIHLPCVTSPGSFAQGAAAVCALIVDEKCKELTGKYLKDNEETQSSEETMNEELQAKLWEMSARYVRLDGYEPLEAVPPAPEEEPEKPKVEKSKKKCKKDKTDEKEKADENLIVENGHNVEVKGEGNAEETEGEKGEKKTASEDAAVEVNTKVPEVADECKVNGTVESEPAKTEVETQEDGKKEDESAERKVEAVDGKTEGETGN